MSAIVYRHHHILAYRQRRWILKWNAEIAPIKGFGSEYMFGNPFDALTADGAVAKARREIDRLIFCYEELKARDKALHPDDHRHYPPPSWDDSA